MRGCSRWWTRPWALIAKFDDLERQLKGIADDKTLSAEERETQSKDLAAQRDAMLKEAMDRLTGKSASQA